MSQGGGTARLFCQGILTWLAGWAVLAFGLNKKNGGRPSQTEERLQMVEEQLVRRGIRDERVLAAMRKVERQRFVSEAQQCGAYEDHPLPIGEGQTISQPYIVALMTEALGLEGGERVLEIGTGSGYQTAILAELAGEVYSVERVSRLAQQAQATLEELGYTNVHIRIGDGSEGWPEHAPYQAILVTAAAPHLPQALVEQLAEGGKLVIPVGVQNQELELHTRGREGVEVRSLGAVRFVPLIADAK